MMNDRRLVDENQDFIEKGAGSRSVVEKLFDEVAPKFADRNGGYTRIIKLAQHRIGDGGMLVSLELVSEVIAPQGHGPQVGEPPPQAHAAQARVRNPKIIKEVRNRRCRPGGGRMTSPDARPVDA